MGQDSQTTAPSREAVASVSKHYNTIKDTFPDAEANFERKWAALVDLCHAQQTAGTAMEGYAETDEFKAVKKLGPKIIPYILFKLVKGDDVNSLLCLVIYEALESDASYRVVPDGESPDLSSKETLQKLCSRVLELNYQRNRTFEERAAAWRAFHEENMLESSGLFFCFCDEYEDLLEMGTSILAPLMVEYAQLYWGFYFHLLHELVHGHKLRAYSYKKDVIYEKTVVWFIEGNHEDAPKYMPTEEDKSFIEDWGGFL